MVQAKQIKPKNEKKEEKLLINIPLNLKNVDDNIIISHDKLKKNVSTSKNGTI